MKNGREPLVNRDFTVALVLSPAFAGLETVMLVDLGLTPQALCSRLLRRLNQTFMQAL